jgi:phosphatidate cytidylyltransferase
LNNLVQRIITAIIGGAAVVFLIYWNVWGFTFLFFVLNAAALWEFYQLVNSNKNSVSSHLSIFLGSFLYLLGSLITIGYLDSKYSVLFFLPPFVLFIVELFRNKENPFTNVGMSILGWIYTTLPFYIISKIAFNDGIYDFSYVFGFLFLLWASDSFAYFVGRFLGSHKLFERISPKKTWEGLMGGLAGALAVAYLISNFYTQLSLTNWLIIAAIIVIVGTIGDLVESMFKRSLEIKDSSSLLPGHGGVLDRFDGLFVSAPFVYVYLSLFA